MYNEVTDQREKVYLSLGKSADGEVQEEEDAKSKIRRLMNFMGSGMSFLFGVCEDECATKANDAIN